MPVRFLALLCLGCWQAWAQPDVSPAGDAEPALAADRPGYTEPPQVIGTNVIQIETGFVWDRLVREEPRHSVTGPYPLIRMGLTRSLELRLSGDGYCWQSFPARNPSRGFRGISDQMVGAKLKLASQSGWRPALALLGTVSMPVGDPEVTSANHDPSFKLSWGRTLPAGMDVSGNLHVGSLSDERGRLLQKSASLSVGKELQAGFSGYIEGSVLRLERETGVAALLNTGLTHPLGRNVQVDLTLGRVVAGRFQGWSVSAGLVVRQPLGIIRRD